jgi:hypothetical protein
MGDHTLFGGAFGGVAVSDKDVRGSANDVQRRLQSHVLEHGEDERSAVAAQQDGPIGVCDDETVWIVVRQGRLAAVAKGYGRVGAAHDAALYMKAGLPALNCALRETWYPERTYGFGLAPLTRGKLFDAQLREQGERQRARELAEGALVERAHFAQQPLGVMEAGLREVGDGLAILDLAEREVEAAGARPTGEGDAEEGISVETADDEDGAIMVRASAVDLATDVDAERASPDLAGVIVGAGRLLMQAALVAAPTVEVLGHTGMQAA